MVRKLISPCVHVYFSPFTRQGWGDRGHARIYGGSPISQDARPHRKPAPVLCCPDRGVAEEEKGGAGTQEVVIGQRLCFLIPL